MDRKKQVAAIQAKLFYGETDTAIREALRIPESTYFYWKDKDAQAWAALGSQQGKAWPEARAANRAGRAEKHPLLPG